MNAETAKLNSRGSERLCYYCNEGRCALCTGADQTIIDGQIVEVPCAHDCRQQAHRKPNQSTTTDRISPKRRHQA